MSNHHLHFYHHPHHHFICAVDEMTGQGKAQYFPNANFNFYWAINNKKIGNVSEWNVVDNKKAWCEVQVHHQLLVKWTILSKTYYLVSLMRFLMFQCYSKLNLFVEEDPEEVPVSCLLTYCKIYNFHFDEFWDGWFMTWAALKYKFLKPTALLNLRLLKRIYLGKYVLIKFI